VHGTPLHCSLLAAPPPPPPPLAAQLLKGLGELAGGLGELLRDARCASINQVYSTFEDTICVTGMQYILTTWVGAFLIGVFLPATFIAFTLLGRRALRRGCARLGLDAAVRTALSPLPPRRGRSGDGGDGAGSAKVLWCRRWRPSRGAAVDKPPLPPVGDAALAEKAEDGHHLRYG
jgi:hypothetical protein